MEITQNSNIMVTNIVKVEASADVTQYYNGRPVMSRYEVTKRSKGNYQIDLYVDGDYTYQWNNENCSDEDFVYDKLNKKVAMQFMINLASEIVIHTYKYLII